MDDLATMGASELGKLLGRSTKSIKLDASRKPETLPPRFVVPGTRNYLWRVKDVRDWMEAWAQVEADKRRRLAAEAKRLGVKPEPRQGFQLANKARGAVATEQLKANQEAST